MKVAGKCVVVTGGASGIGRALAERFAAEGARGVVVADINAEWAWKVATRIGGRALGVGCDVADPRSIDELVRVSHESFGQIEIFCSSAGFTDPAPGDLSAPVEWLARNHGHRGIGVSCLCPNAAYTAVA